MATNQKSTVLRYCPVVGHNIIVEFSYDSGLHLGKKGNGCFNCLNSRECTDERVGCTYRILTVK